MNPNLKSSKLVTISVLLVLSSLQNWANAKPEVPCYFIFGDSMSDNGNNNNLNTLAKVNYLPYGNAFPEGPTGRFTNGRTLHDFIVELLGFKRYMPPFSQVRGKDVLKGVNYASGSAGILDETGKNNMGARISMNQQILQNHRAVVSKITKDMWDDPIATQKHLNKCIYSIQIGSNDYLNNYFKPKFYDTSRRHTLTAFTNILIQQLSQQLRILYDYGARKFAVYGLPMIGCTPSAILEFGTNGKPCVDTLNEGATIFNEKVKSLVHQLNMNLTSAKLTYLNPPGVPVDLSIFAKAEVCCEIGGGGGELCIRDSRPCSSPEKYIFWDGVHLTETQYKMIAESAYSCTIPSCASPFNIQKLANL
ncbi:hypothetical protein like AT1G29670 [Hibiscus trionum]|uniref:GDSL esterase/lipase n=1 Tax=Hibiscus trionum TaxID=183268 RepID=A0A9W7HBX6_HIBTR|nr:hypothetical protein like AT1G29670 [Hibiscus trionum]